MNPAEIMLVDGLVNRQVKTAKQSVEALVLGSGASGDVDGLAKHVLTCWCAPHSLVESRAAVAAVHMDGRAPCLSQRVEDILHESVEVVNHLLRWCVVDAPQSGCSGAGKLRDSEIFHISSWFRVKSSSCFFDVATRRKVNNRGQKRAMLFSHKANARVGNG